MQKNTITRQTYAIRREKVRKALAENNLDALLVSFAANRYYLSGFELHDAQCNESSGMLVITRSGKDWLLTDSRYLEAAKGFFPEETIFIYTAPTQESIGHFLKDTVKGVVGFEAQAVSFSFHKTVSNIREMVPCSGIVEGIRRIKEPAEIECIRRSCALNHRVFEQIEPQLLVGKTEKEIAWEIEQLFRNQGASELSFDSIVATGPRGALPHARAGDDCIRENSPVLIDMGCRLEEYCSDQTRVFWIGNKPSPQYEKTLEQVRTAQKKAIACIRPGTAIADAYKAAREYFDQQGVAQYFTHALGHGIGLETHEAPGLGARTKNVFEPGMVVTAEPGLYYPEWGGVRWEYMLLVTEQGCEVL